MAEEKKTACNLMEEMEEAMAELYKKMARVFSSDEEASSLFSRLAREEMGHRLTIQLERRIIKQNPGVFLGEGPKAGALKETLHQAQETLQKVHTLSLKEAMRRVLALEDSCAERHCRGIRENVPPELARLLANLRAGDKAHLEALEAFAKRRGFVHSEGGDI